MAEGILHYKANEAGLKWIVESAGTNGYHNGEAPHPLSRKVAFQYGIDISQQRSRKFIPADFHAYDIIYVMAEDVIDDIKRIAKKEYNEQKIRLLMNELYPGNDMDIPDPWSGPEAGYHTVYKMLEEACDAIVSKYNPQPLRGS